MHVQQTGYDARINIHACGTDFSISDDRRWQMCVQDQSGLDVPQASSWLPRLACGATGHYAENDDDRCFAEPAVLRAGGCWYVTCAVRPVLDCAWIKSSWISSERARRLPKGTYL